MSRTLTVTCQEAGVAAKGIGRALDLTLASLREGVVGLGVEAALPEISGWEERLASSGDPDLETVAATLGELRAQLDSPGLDPVSFGSLLMTLGQQVEGVGVKVGDRLARLGALLGSEGDALTDKMTRV